MVLTVAGASAGLVGALVTSRALTSLLFEVSPTDPIALGSACVILVLVGAIAAFLPARGATNIDPMQALRSE